MTIEYYLQKKTLGGWSHVTSYTDLEQAKRNFASCVGNGMSGFCWRLVEVSELQVSMLDDVVDVEPLKLETAIPAIKSGWGNPPQDAPKSSGWGQAASGWGKSTSINPGVSQPPSSELRHGLTGSVWVVHHSERKKSRVPASELDSYLEKGYIKAGPRTQFYG